MIQSIHHFINNTKNQQQEHSFNSKHFFLSNNSKHLFTTNIDNNNIFKSNFSYILSELIGI